MTYKQIMIDNVDVSECEHVFARTRLFKEKNFVECTAFFLENEDSRCNCSDNPNCYYKQLKRKEQELDKIKTICEKETTKSTFCNGIENKDTQKLAIKILKIIIEDKNNG